MSLCGWSVESCEAAQPMMTNGTTARRVTVSLDIFVLLNGFQLSTDDFSLVYSLICEPDSRSGAFAGTDDGETAVKFFAAPVPFPYLFLSRNE